MRGDFVIVRGISGRGAIGRVWDADSHSILVTDEKGFARLMAGSQTVIPIGFRPEDVFTYDPKHANSLANVDWTKLLLWNKALSRPN